MSYTIEIGTADGKPYAIKIIQVASDSLWLRLPGQAAGWMAAEDLRRAAEQQEDEILRLTWAPVWDFVREVWAQREAEVAEAEAEAQRRAAKAEARAVAKVRACRHAHYEVEAELPYTGSVVGPDGDERLAAHGNVCLRDRCSRCGAVRLRNVNVGQEVGRWHVDPQTIQRAN